MNAYGVTDKGKARKLNEDFYYLPKETERFIVVADGMGGHAAGEVASFIAVTQIAEYLRKAPSCGETRMKEAFERANESVYAASSQDATREGMGTTLTAIWISGNVCCLGHIGDSRAYRLRDGKLEQISEDHSYVGELVKSGMITKEQAKTHPKRNLITRCIGVFSKIEPQIERLDYREADIWLLCTDGLVNYVDDKEIESCLMQEDINMDAKITKLKNMALERGGADNITVVALCGGSDA